MRTTLSIRPRANVKVRCSHTEGIPAPRGAPTGNGCSGTAADALSLAKKSELCTFMRQLKAFYGPEPTPKSGISDDYTLFIQVPFRLSEHFKVHNQDFLAAQRILDAQSAWERHAKQAAYAQLTAGWGNRCHGESVPGTDSPWQAPIPPSPAPIPLRPSCLQRSSAPVWS